MTKKPTTGQLLLSVSLTTFFFYCQFQSLFLKLHSKWVIHNLLSSKYELHTVDAFVLKCLCSRESDLQTL